MPQLLIDDIPVEVPPGTSVLEAARSVGITIPHFCYHPALAIAAACRLCAVKLLDGPVKGIQMSCSLPAQDGMVVSTTDPEAVKLRSLVIEWLMLNHPHDCPVCDEGGECLLQDFTVAGGHGVRRYQGKKRTHVNQYLGKGIEHEMNRCIQCYRCVRFYQEYAGGTDFGTTGSAGRVYFGRFQDGALASPFSGNLVDICPTGVFTDKTGRFRARYWDYQFAPSLCPHCSAGCNLSPQAFQREVIKIVARRNDEVNGWFICDRARFDKTELNDPLRPRQPLVDGEVVKWDRALDALAARLLEFVERHGVESLALVGSPRLSLEGGLLLARLAQHLGGRLSLFAGDDQAQGSLQAVKRLERQQAASQADLRGADCIALFGCNLMEEAPMLALAVRQAYLKGAKVYLVAPDLTTLDLSLLPFPVEVVPELADVPFSDAKSGVLVSEAGCQKSGDLDHLLGSPVKLALLQPGPNAFGAALVTRQWGGSSLDELLAARKIRGIFALEADLLPESVPGLTFFAAADWKNGEACAKASVFLPTTAWAEGEGTWINYEGRAQRFLPAVREGLPLRGLPARYYGTAEAPPPAHPPRVHRGSPPEGEARDAWRLVAALIEKLTGEPAGEIWTGPFEPLKGIDPEGPGVLLSPPTSGKAP